jgi:threonine/homoserine/homoserine lactone efflux protein
MNIFQLLGIFILGFIGGATPGPVLAASFTESLRKGFVKSLPIVFMALISEVLIALFILTLFFSINIPKSIFYIISFIGAGVLVWLAVQVWKIKEIGGESQVFDFKKIFLFTVLNGPFWIFWITVCVPQAFLLKEEIAFGQAIFLIIFELGWFVATVSLIFIFSRFRSLLVKSKLIPIAFKVFALILLYFAIRLTITSILYFT